MTTPEPMPGPTETADETKARETRAARRRRQDRYTVLVRLARLEREAREAQRTLGRTMDEPAPIPWSSRPPSVLDEEPLSHQWRNDAGYRPEQPWVPPELWDMARVPFEHENWDGPDWRIWDIATLAVLALAAVGLASIILAIARRF